MTTRRPPRPAAAPAPSAFAFTSCAPARRRPCADDVDDDARRRLRHRHFISAAPAATGRLAPRAAGGRAGAHPQRVRRRPRAPLAPAPQRRQPDHRRRRSRSVSRLDELRELLDANKGGDAGGGRRRRRASARPSCRRRSTRSTTRTDELRVEDEHGPAASDSETLELWLPPETSTQRPTPRPTAAYTRARGIAHPLLRAPRTRKTRPRSAQARVRRVPRRSRRVVPDRARASDSSLRRARPRFIFARSARRGGNALIVAAAALVPSTSLPRSADPPTP